MKRSVNKIIKATPRKEGPANVHRALPSDLLPFFDPFLAIGEFRMPPEKRGFGFHPHQGVEFITYQLAGQLEHNDPEGNQLLIKEGEAIHLVAGRGMVHSETPLGTEESQGIQLWIDLPKINKNDPHTFNKAGRDKIIITNSNGAIVRTIASPEGPITLHTPMVYLDIFLEENTRYNYILPVDWNAFILVLDGNAFFGENQKEGCENDLLVFGTGDEIEVTSLKKVRFLLLAAKPLNEGGKGMFG